MGFRYRHLDMKSRLTLTIGNIALSSGLILWVFVHPSTQVEKDWLHGLCGFLLGLSITINLFMLRFAGRCGPNPTETDSALRQ
ncbi:MAG: hypothetical protein WBQ94_06905 [Terracidiphilus sp.]